MAISISSRPEKTKGTYTSLWIAANNPVVFEFTTSGSPIDEGVQVALFEADGFTRIVEFDPIPFPSSNTIQVDFSAFLQSELDNSDTSLTSQVNADNLQTSQFKVFRVGFNNVNSSYTVDSTQYVALNNVKQAGDVYGANLADYVMDYDDSTSTVNAKGKFLSTFQNPVLWWYSPSESVLSSNVTVFHPSLAWILPKEYENETDYKIESKYNLPVTGTVTRTITLSSAKGLRFANYVTSVPTSDSIYTHSTFTTSILDSNDQEIIEKITFEVRRACNNPVAIKWKDKLGSWQVWVFEGDANRGHNVESADSVGLPFNDIETLTRTSKTLRKTEIPTLSVSADNLTKDQVLGLSGISVSPNVLLCTNDFQNVAGQDADNWVSINVLDSSVILYNERLSRYRIAFDFELIELFTINN